MAVKQQQRHPNKLKLSTTLLLVVVCAIFYSATTLSLIKFAVVPSTSQLDTGMECHRLDLLQQALRDDPENNGLRPVTAERFTFHGIDLSYIRGRRIALFGDSTLFYFTKWVYLLLDNQTKVDGLATKTLPDGQDFIFNQAITVHPMSSDVPIPFVDKRDDTYIDWAGMSGVDDHLHTEQFLTRAWKKVEGTIRPNIMVVNMGMHWLHFYGIVRDTSAEAIRRWINYEDWLSEVYEKARSMHVKVLLFKTTNLVCEEKLYDNFLDANRLYHAEDPATIQKCITSVEPIFTDGSLSASQIHNYCVNGTMNDVGSRYLNQRLQDFVKKLKPTLGMYANVFNDHDIQQCRHAPTDDGLHYHRSNLMRVRMLTNMIKCGGG